jgi:SynChlorMet cassette protein ScmD
MKPTDTPIADPQIVLREEFDDWAVLFHPSTGEAVGTGPVGVVIFRALDGQRTLAEIAAQIEALCEDAPDTVLEDTLAFVDELQQHAFLLAEEEGKEE